MRLQIPLAEWNMEVLFLEGAGDYRTANLTRSEGLLKIALRFCSVR